MIIFRHFNEENVPLLGIANSHILINSDMKLKLAYLETKKQEKFSLYVLQYGLFMFKSMQKLFFWSDRKKPQPTLHSSTKDQIFPKM